jgi:hypothetical protein
VVRARLLVRLQSSTVQYVLGASVLPWYIVSALDNSAVGCITLLCTTHHFCPNRSRLWRGCDHCQDLGSRFQVHGGSTQSCTYTVPVFGSDPCIVHCSSYCTAYCTEYCTAHCTAPYTTHCTAHCTAPYTNHCTAHCNALPLVTILPRAPGAHLTAGARPEARGCSNRRGRSCIHLCRAKNPRLYSSAIYASTPSCQVVFPDGC